MIKAVFFDWFNTLARYEPPREELYQKAFREAGFEISLKDILRALLVADQHHFAENIKRPIRERSLEEQMELLSSYPRLMLAEAKLSAPADLPVNMIRKLMKDYRNLTMGLFEDVLPNLKLLKERDLIMSVLTNADKKGVSALCERLGLNPFMNFVTTSQEAGAEKPSPRIFLLALERAGVKPEEAVHVGDQYRADVLGAKGVGIKAVLLDRFDLNPEVRECPRITTLNELAQYLDA